MTGGSIYSATQDWGQDTGNDQPLKGTCLVTAGVIILSGMDGTLPDPATKFIRCQKFKSCPQVTGTSCFLGILMNLGF